MQEYLYRHFSSQGHTGFLSDVSVILFDKMDGSEPQHWEDFSMKILKIMSP